MGFGKFLGDKGLDAQKAGLAESLALLASIERRVEASYDLYEQFTDVWGDGVPEDLTTRLGLLRKIGDLLDQRVKMAKRELPDFDTSAALLKDGLPALDQQWTVFAAMLLARKTIAEKRGSPRPEPGVEECQYALIGLVNEALGELRTHLDELTPIRARRSGPWPAMLDLERFERCYLDMRGAIDVYHERLREGQGKMPDVSTCTLMEMLTMAQNSVMVIEDQRVNLAMDSLMRDVMRNTGVA